jgi:hypothetical protein
MVTRPILRDLPLTAARIALAMRCLNCGGLWLNGDELNLIDKELVKIKPVRGHDFLISLTTFMCLSGFRRIKRPSPKLILKLKWNR